MNEKVSKLHLQFIKVKSMTGFCNIKVFEVNKKPESCEELEINGEPYLRLPTLFAPGSDGAVHTQALEDSADLYTLTSKVISVQTVSGTERKDFTCRKLKIRTKEGVNSNYDSIKVNTIGLVRRYIVTIVKLCRMSEEQKKYFLARANPKPVQGIDGPKSAKISALYD